MYQFWLRFLVFVFLWTYMVVTFSDNIGVSILFFAMAIGGFFFLSLPHVPALLYLFLTVIISVHGLFFVENNAFTVILIVYISIISAFRLREKKLKRYVLLNMCISIGFSFLQNGSVLETAVIVALFYFLILLVNHLDEANKEQKGLYEELLGEYRKLKRMNLLTEQDARTEERNRIARDIHDSVGHRLTALIMKLEMLAIQRKNEEYRDIKVIAEDALEETRHAVKALQNEKSAGIATVVHLIRKLEAESHLIVQFTVKQGVLSIPLSNEKSVVLYRTIQEALTNAMRHAHSKEVHIILGKSAIGDVTFEISNAVYQVKPFTSGFGLTNMKKRLEEIEGRLEVYQTETTFVVTGIIPA